VVVLWFGRLAKILATRPAALSQELACYSKRMDYEFAKSLMEGGFPQMGRGGSIGSPDEFVWRISDRVYVPTLEELIDACEENFGSLDKQHGGWLACANGDRSCFAVTPAEAVARLWLTFKNNDRREGAIIKT
jgi:hypothetical protein